MLDVSTHLRYLQWTSKSVDTQSHVQPCPADSARVAIKDQEIPLALHLPVLLSCNQTQIQVRCICSRISKSDQLPPSTRIRDQRVGARNLTIPTTKVSPRYAYTVCNTHSTRLPASEKLTLHLLAARKAFIMVSRYCSLLVWRSVKLQTRHVSDHPLPHSQEGITRRLVPPPPPKHPKPTLSLYCGRSISV